MEDGSTAPAPPASTSSLQAVAVVVNGNAKSVTDEVISNLDEILRDTDLYVSRSLEQARDIARTLVAKRYGTVLTGGGDGTFTVMVTEVVHAAEAAGSVPPRFGYIKLGTGNALAHVVGASGKRMLGADIRRLKEEAGSRQIGLVEVEGLLTPFCGLGADAVVLQDYQQVKESLGRTPLQRFAAGPLSYAISTTTRTMPSYLLRRMSHCRITNLGAEAYRLGRNGRIWGRGVATGEVIYEGSMRLVAASTIPYYGFGLRMFPFSEERPDRMSLRVSCIGPLQFARNVRAIWKGEYENPASLFDYLVSHVRIDVDPATALQVGGDVMGERSSVEVKLSDTPIRLVDFYAPPNASR